MSRLRTTFWRQWGWPIFLAVLTIAGLLSALAGEGGIWWGLSWCALAFPLPLIAYYLVHAWKKP